VPAHRAAHDAGPDPSHAGHARPRFHNWYSIGLPSQDDVRAKSYTGARPIIRSVDVIYPITGITDGISVKGYPKSVSNFLFSDFVLSGNGRFTAQSDNFTRTPRRLGFVSFPVTQRNSGPMVNTSSRLNLPPDGGIFLLMVECSLRWWNHPPDGGIFLSMVESSS
jgi:hypothetical protein